jgi:hypothetical protein
MLIVNPRKARQNDEAKEPETEETLSHNQAKRN